MRHLVGFVFLLLALGTLRTVGCGDADPCGDCGDGNPCTIDQCSSRRVGEPPGMCEPDERPVEPYCSHRAEPDGTPCGGGNGVSGVCIDGFCDLCEGVVCDDGNECTWDCNPATGTCDYIPVQDGTKCDDGDDNDCAEDICIRGACTGDGTPVTCDDGKECTEDTCEPPEGCVATTVDDGTPCGNGAATCQAGNCMGVFACTEEGIRDAIEVGDGPHTFDCAGPTIVVTEAWIEINNNVILDGEGDLTIDARGGHPVLVVRREHSLAGPVTVELWGVAVIGGQSGWGAGGITTGSGTFLTLKNSTVSGNTGNSGGIENAGTLTLINSTVSGNTALYSGGGIHSDGPGGAETLTLINSTVSGNTAGSSGGGIDNVNSSVMLINSTVSGNTASTDGSGIRNLTAGGEFGALTLINTLVDNECSGDDVSSNGHNIESPGNTCGFDQTGDQPSVPDPMLGPLQDNGGPTETHALLPGSPAINQIPVEDCVDAYGALLATDQRGEPRPETGGDACDVGAFERQSDDP